MAQNNLVSILTTLLNNNSTELDDRILWFDGDSTVSDRVIIDHVLTGNSIKTIFVDEISDEIAQYNLLMPKEKQIKTKEFFGELSFEWDIPDEFKEIDIISYVSDKLFIKEHTTVDFEEKQARCAMELNLYKKFDLFNTIRLLIYIVDVLENNNIVWGVGRGSSVASYVLYLIGVHDIDSFCYGLDITEFLRA